MNKIEQRFEELNKKITEAKEKVEVKKEEDKAKITDSLQTAKGELNASKEQVKDLAEETKQAGFAEMLKLKMNMEQKHEEFKEKIATKKYESEKHRKDEQVDFAFANAAYCVDLALVAIDEATVAALEYIEKELEYAAEYGEEA